MQGPSICVATLTQTQFPVFKKLLNPYSKFEILKYHQKSLNVKRFLSQTTVVAFSGNGLHAGMLSLTTSTANTNGS